VLLFGSGIVVGASFMYLRGGERLQKQENSTADAGVSQAGTEKSTPWINEGRVQKTRPRDTVATQALPSETPGPTQIAGPNPSERPTPATVFDSEPMDRSRRGDEADLAASIAASIDRSISTVLSVECKRSICRAEFEHKPESGVDGHLNLMRRLDLSTPFMIQKLDGRRTAVFVERAVTQE